MNERPNCRCALQLVSRWMWTLRCGVTYFLQLSAFEKDNKRLFDNLTPASPELEERASTQ
jgi:hypothetical protein